MRRIFLTKRICRSIMAALIFSALLLIYYKLVQKFYAQKMPRVFCAVMTIQSNHKSKVQAIRNTWMKRCDKTIFFTNRLDIDTANATDMIAINTSDGRDHLWSKTRAVFLHLHEYYARDFDWFLKSDDDTYFIMENLKLLLSKYNPDDRLWIGCEFVHHTHKIHFPSGGAGYALSRASLFAFAEKVKNESTDQSDQSYLMAQKRPIQGCGLDGGSLGEDVRFSECLRSAGVSLIDAQDQNGRFRFLPTMLEHFVYSDRNGGNAWIQMYRKLGQGIKDCCDKNLISIHYAHPKLMYVYEYLIYHFKLGQ